MADSDNVSNNENNEIKQEPDAVAEFLDREKQQFAELDEINDVNDHAEMTASQPSEEKDSPISDVKSVQFDHYDALKEDGPPRIETAKILKWREEQTERLTIKDAESEKRKKEWLQAAVLELDEYKRHLEEMLVKTKKSNRQGEEVFVRERDEKRPGGEWERVCRMCDFNPKTATRPVKDISRLRSLLLQLKQTPNVSFAAA